MLYAINNILRAVFLVFVRIGVVQSPRQSCIGLFKPTQSYDMPCYVTSRSHMNSGKILPKTFALTDEKDSISERLKDDLAASEPPERLIRLVWRVQEYLSQAYSLPFFKFGRTYSSTFKSLSLTVLLIVSSTSRVVPSKKTLEHESAPTSLLGATPLRFSVKSISWDGMKVSVLQGKIN